MRSALTHEPGVVGEYLGDLFEDHLDEKQARHGPVVVCIPIHGIEYEWQKFVLALGNRPTGDRLVVPEHFVGSLVAP